jgi:hypothetical protein
MEGYVDALQKCDYDKAISYITPELVEADKEDGIVRLAIKANPVDNPDFIRRLMTTFGISIHNYSPLAVDTMEKPKTFYLLLHAFGLYPDYFVLKYLVQNKKRIVAVMIIEFVYPSWYTHWSKKTTRVCNALSHAKQATYALLASYKLLGKDVTRIIAKIVWGSRANVNWEK